MYVPEKGDIISLDFDPSAGHEIMKRRPGLVLSRKAFNEHTGFAVVAPITSSKRGMALEVELEKEETRGAVLIHQLRSLDTAARSAEFVEKASVRVINRATELALIVLK